MADYLRPTSLDEALAALLKGAGLTDITATSATWTYATADERAR